MLLFVNSKSRNVPDDVDTVGKLIDFLRISRQGTGVGVNNKLVKAADWDYTPLKNDDSVLIISAAYGG